MRWWARRRPEGFNLAFLDIMSCGLGAIILIFMLVKYNAAESDAESISVDESTLQSELEQAQDQVNTITASNRALAAQLEKLKQDLQQKMTQAAGADEEASETVQTLVKLTSEIAALEKKLAQQKQTSEEVESDDNTKQDHLIGLRVSGRRILILLDSSASMAAERLVDIVKIKASNTAAKKSAPKWQRARAIANWIIRRVPEESDYMVIHYNAQADFLPANKWLKGGDQDARANVLTAMKKLYPQGATNLHAPSKLIKSTVLAPTDIYVITDSLPTQGTGNLAALVRFKQCGLSTTKKTVSGECRLALFFSAIQSFARISARVNTVLLPIEGDPDAAYAYWAWTASTTGTMISPAGSWP